MKSYLILFLDLDVQPRLEVRRDSRSQCYSYVPRRLYRSLVPKDNPGNEAWRMRMRACDMPTLTWPFITLYSP